MTSEYSIIIPVFNAEHSIEAMLNSVFNDLPDNFEVIVVDDASTDNGIDIAKKFPVQILTHSVNKGPSAARNTGAKAARFETLIFLDADVELYPDSLNNLCHRSER